ncbi:MAG: NAD(P)H-dependent oxidoreductase subunit E [Nitrospinae bacterium]|nr:NAD(P)H-dependent oxidoreductase subunit E [Nitrospinota bacterium]
MTENASTAYKSPAKIEALLSRQKEDGYLSKEAITEISKELGVPIYDSYGLASFFPHFHLEKPAKPKVHICRDMSCLLAGGDSLLDNAKTLARRAGVRNLQPESCACLGRCDKGPAAEIEGRIYSALTDEKFQDILESWKNGAARPSSRSQKLKNATRINPYRKNEAFGVLRSLMRSTNPESVIDILKESGLRGMGGAGFPVGLKWSFVLGAPGTEKFVICNADESEPGTFKDRAIMDSHPELVVEGILIACRAVGAERAIIYIRHEYGAQAKKLERAIERARKAHLIGTKSTPRLEIFTSPGGYICGEETALLEVLEDKRAQPRDKPPFPGTAGLFGKPTLINNVETFALIPAVLKKGASWFTSFGRNGTKGFKVVGVSGAVRKPGIYEVEFGTPIREIIEGPAGGLPAGARLKAFSPGGASSGFLPANLVDVPYDFTPLQEAGSMLGSGALVVIPEGVDMVALAHNVVRFFRDESCGKCVPCRLGTEKLTAFLERLLREEATASELPAMREICETMKDTSICGLGQAAPIPYLSLFEYFEPDIESRLK